MKTLVNQNSEVRKRIKERKEMRKYLRRNDLSRLARMADVSRTTVTEWFKGAIVRSSVEAYVDLLVEKRKEEMLNNISGQL